MRYRKFLDKKNKYNIRKIIFLFNCCSSFWRKILLNRKKNWIRIFFLDDALKSVHFKNTVARSSVHSKLWSFWAEIKTNSAEDRATVLLKWTDFSRSLKFNLLILSIPVNIQTFTRSSCFYKMISYAITAYFFQFCHSGLIFQHLKNTCRKVASSRLSRWVAHLRIFRLFLMGKFDAYVLWPFAKRVQNWIVDRSTAHDFTVYVWNWAFPQMLPKTGILELIKFWWYFGPDKVANQERKSCKY